MISNTADIANANITHPVSALDPLRVQRVAGMPEQLRVGLLAGTLGQGGAEKQLVYIARALQQVGVDVRIFSLTKNEYYESALQSVGLAPQWIGQHEQPMLRLLAISKAVRQFHPHVLQSTHFFTNLYAAVVAWQQGIVGIGGIRNDAKLDLSANRHWGYLLSRVPHSLIANSFGARQNAKAIGLKTEKIHVLQNVIDLAEFDSQSLAGGAEKEVKPILAVAVGRLVQFKRFENFITALAKSRTRLRSLQGAIIGDGPERARLEATARAHGLSPFDLRFLGRRDDIPQSLKDADMLVLCSDHEGFPNVILEAMAARLPVITTPAGDASLVVQDGITGYVVPFGEVNAISDRLVQLGRDSRLRVQLGAAGRRRVEEEYSFDKLANSLIGVYRDIARQQHKRLLLQSLASICHTP